jgi:hypothetical protein
MNIWILEQQHAVFSGAHKLMNCIIQVFGELSGLFRVAIRVMYLDNPQIGVRNYLR